MTDLEPCFVWHHIADLVCDFRPVRRSELLHDVANVNLYRALAQVQLVGDDLVSLAAAQAFGNRGLACSERGGDVAKLFAPNAEHLAQCKDAAGWYKLAAGDCQLDGLHAYADAACRRDVTAYAELERLEDVREVVIVGDYD